MRPIDHHDDGPAAHPCERLSPTVDRHGGTKGWPLRLAVATSLVLAAMTVWRGAATAESPDGTAFVLAASAEQPSHGQGETSSAASRIKTRFGRHKGFRRLVFEWSRPIDYRLEKKRGAAVVRFSRPGKYDLSKYRDNLRRGRIHVTEVAGSDNLVVRIEFPPGRRLRHYRSGGVVVIDILDRPTATPDTNEPKAKPQTSRTSRPRPLAQSSSPADPAVAATAKPDGDAASSFAPLTAMPRPKVDEVPVPPSLPGPAGPAPTVSVATAPAPNAGGGAIGTGASGATVVPLPAGPAPAGVQAPAPGSGEMPSATATRSGDELAMRFEWPAKVALAAFRRGRHIWLVFSGRPAPRLDAIRNELGGAYYAIETLAHDKATVIRLTAARSLNPTLRADRRSWIVKVGPRTGRPRTAIAVEAQPHAATGSRVLLSAGAGGAVVQVRDPEVGDSLLVVPVTAAGVGVELEREFAQFRLLPTNQGVVVAPFSDAVEVRSVMDGVVVTSRAGLRLSGAGRGARNKLRARNPAARIFDFAAWRSGTRGEDALGFIREKQRLQQAIALASDAQKNTRRLALAQFYFGYGQGADAIGLMKIIEADDAELANEPPVRAMRGAARLLTHDLDGAADDLNHASLDDQPEVALWRGALAATRREWRAAVSQFGRARGLLHQYPKYLKVRFGLLAAEAELVAGTVHRARGYLNTVLEANPARVDRDEMRYLKGRVLEQIGEADAALTQWQQVAESGRGTGRIKAEVARIDLLRSRGKLTDIDPAVAALDRLRFAWRGDALEFSVLHLLGRLYLDKGDYKHGLDTLRRAMRLYPGLARDRQLPRDLQNAFARIFDEGIADDMPPIKALALFQGFRELVPNGPRGDQMIERLANRLVSVDLLSQAAGLLADQVARRLRGNERARVGARLALVYLLDKNPGEALNALEATAVPGIPSALAAERRRLQARAYAAVGQNRQAMELLVGDDDRDADLLRADIYWRQQKWAEAAKVLGMLARGIRVPQTGKFSESDSRLVLRWTVALALDGDTAGLAAVRRRFDGAMDQGPYADAYRVVATEVERGSAFSYDVIVAKIAEVDRFQAFLANYRERLQTSGLSAIN